jgi:hypothetical protein
LVSQKLVIVKRNDDRRGSVSRGLPVWILFLWRSTGGCNVPYENAAFVTVMYFLLVIGEFRLIFIIDESLRAAIARFIISIRTRAVRPGVRIMAEVGVFFSLPRNVQSGSGVHAAICSVGTGVICR